jgi:hypothetical protein
VEAKNKSLKGEAEAKKEQLGRVKPMQQELKQSRTFKARFLNLASSLKEGAGGK